MQAPRQARDYTDDAHTKTARTVTQEPSSVDQRLATIAQRQIADTVSSSPRMLQKKAQGAAIQNSPRMATQRHTINALFGGAVQPQGSVVQRYVGSYAEGTTLAYTTLAMRDLKPEQMKIVQELHDDEDNDYTIQEARDIAIKKTSLFPSSSASSNRYEWDVTGIGSYATPDQGVQDILNNFGHPTQPVVKVYQDLADRVNYDVGSLRKGALSSSTVMDLHQHFDAMAPLHFGMNPFLNSAWEDNLDNYSGAKAGIPLYSVMRSQITKNFNAEYMGKASMNDVLKEVSGRSPEIHHLLFKALEPNRAADTNNLMLTERSERESEFGPGQHELMHMVASGNHKDKFRELLPQYTAEYLKWVKSKGM